MKTVDEVYRSNFLRAEDLAEGKLSVFTVREASWETFKSDGKEAEKLVLGLEETTREWVVNATNARLLSGFLGSPDPAEWVGAKVKVHSTPVQFGGRTVPAIRVLDARRAKADKPVETPPQAAPQSARPVITDDDIPF
jgi:hypothetical protein